MHIPYSRKYWRGIKFGRLAVCELTAKLKSVNFYSRVRTWHHHIILWVECHVQHSRMRRNVKRCVHDNQRSTTWQCFATLKESLPPVLPRSLYYPRKRKREQAAELFRGTCPTVTVSCRSILQQHTGQSDCRSHARTTVFPQALATKTSSRHDVLVHSCRLQSP